MSEQSAKPYLVRAICEWCADNGLTPYLAVKVNAETRVPQGFVKNGEIVLNVSHSATRKLTVDNDWIRFTARFNGHSQEVLVPMATVAGIFAKETGYGFAFTVSGDPIASLVGSTPAASALEGAAEPDATAKPDKRKARPPHLQVIK